MAKIGDFVNLVAAAAPDTPGSDLFERFQVESNTMAIAVVGDDDQPLGLIERNAFCLKMAAEFGRALFARRPASTLMDPAPLIVDAEADAEILFRSVDVAELGTLLKGFVVTSAGRYLGIGTALDVLQAGSVVYRRRAEEMSALAQDLSRAEGEARASSRAKSEFLAVMSHEIRTPLNGVLGVAALMERELQQETLRPHVRTILDSGQILLRLLTDALDMSRAEADMLTLESAPLRLTAIGEDLTALWSPRAEEQGLNLSVTCDTVEQDWVVGDHVRLKQLLNNLIGNAMKFTPAGAVAVHLSSHLKDGRVCVYGSVDDSGPGVSDAATRSIFEPFNTGTTGTLGAGAGLGLSICRQIVSYMDGDLELEPSLLGGARFRFSLHLPCAPAEMLVAAEATAEPTPHETLHVLVVDDNATNRFVVGKVLELFGCSHEAVNSGAAAVRRAAEGGLDLILMDIKMPGMDGMEATRAIRALEGPAARIPILALTANADPRDEVDYLAAGMNGVAQKPIQPDVLLNAIRRVMTEPVEVAAA
ncbi:response regulator [uncultured Brevundimonas sp.]|uniref:response regulator n=1 Tax=uncultured Brevundimonas sp. TaxID=213418 RepID=UPI0030EB9619|tara:strand:+ start:7794 stop:9395 length:1602 start_codon:yes stop_codon:yes gene_type:complete